MLSLSRVQLLLFALGMIVSFHGCKTSKEQDPAPVTSTTPVPQEPAPQEEPKQDVLAGYTTFTIPSGAQYATSNAFSLYSKSELRFLVSFDSSAIYQTKDPSNQLDINKLYGFSDCGTSHQTNSARFGWRWSNNQLEIHAYTYANAVRSYQFIKAVKLNEPVECRLAISGDKYVFAVNDTSVTMQRGCSETGVKYRLYPYFGGDETAPHKITIAIKEL